MKMLLTTQKAFETVKKYLKDNQYIFSVEKNTNGYLVKIS